MEINNDIKLQVLLDHHKDTFFYQKGYLRYREKLFFIVLIIVALMLLDFTNNGTLGNMISAFIYKQVGKDMPISLFYIKSLIWLILFSVVIKYFQLNLLIERQYTYLKKIEDHMSHLIGISIRRESADYLDHYPWLCEFAHFIYTALYPISLMIFTIIEIYSEYKTINYPFIYKSIDTTFASITAISILLYLGYMYRLRDKVRATFNAFVNFIK